MSRSRTVLVAASAALILGIPTSAAVSSTDQASPTWPGHTSTVTTWAASADMAGGTLSNVTVRNVVHTSIGGEGLRLRLSNAKGNQPLTLDSVYVGSSAGGAAVRAGTNRRVTFQGASSVTIPPGAIALSDPLRGRITAQQDLAVSIHVAGDSGALTAHNRSMQHSWKSTTGDFAADESATPFGTESSAWFWLDAILVEAHHSSGTVATLGDSITAGVGTTINANRRWPDRLADRFAKLPAPFQMGVANEGISGNRVLSGVSRPGGAGDAALTRLTRDILTKPGVETVLLAEGVNDIGAGSSAADIIAGYRQLIAQAHAQDVCIVAATIMPFGGSVFIDPEGETVRTEVNDFIRHGREFDDVVDFDAATRDPDDPTQLRPAFHNGDGLHPNDAGNAAMAGAIDLRDLRCS